MNRSEIRAQETAALEKTKGAVQPTDLREITRHTDKCRTLVRLFPDWNEQNAIDWITCGQANLQHNERQNIWMLKVYLTEWVTDFEHDTSYAFQLPLIGLSFQSLDYHQTTFAAWVDPNNLEGFRVPRPGYNPMKLPDATRCKGRKSDYCKIGEPHIIIPEGYLAGPPTDLELYKAVRGKKVEIRIGPVYKDE